MLAALATSAASFAPPTEPFDRRVFDRRAFIGGAALAAASRTAPAQAQRSKLIPRSSAESTASFKQYQLSEAKYKPGEESEAFKKAEAARNGGAAGKPSSAQDDLARLGLKSFSDSNTDMCQTWKGCNGR